MRKKRLVTMDLDTGEILDGIPVFFNAKVKWKEDWFMGIQQSFIEIAKDRELTGRPKDVLYYLFGKLGFENYICLQQIEIAEELCMEKSQVSKSLSLLLDKGIILPGPKLGRSKSYRLNSNYGWKGKVKNLSATRDSHLKIVK